MPARHAIIKIFLVATLFASQLIGGEQSENHFNELIAKVKAESQAAAHQLLKFEEHRIFPFKKKPVVLNGEIRIWKDRGSSLAYPEKRIVIISSAQGSIYRKRNAAGKTVDRKIPPNRSKLGTLLKSLFTFDFAPLEQSFVFEYSEIDNGAMLTLSPNPDTSAAIQSATITVDSESIHSILIDFGKGKSIKILPQSMTRLENGFSKEDVERYF